VRPERSDAPGGGAHAEGKRGASLIGAASAAVARSQGIKRRPLIPTHRSGVCRAGLRCLSHRSDAGHTAPADAPDVRRRARKRDLLPACHLPL